MTTTERTLVVEAAGVPLTAYETGGICSVVAPSTVGSHGLQSNGGFECSPSPGFSWWTWFSFRPSKGSQIGTPVVVFVLVRPQFGPWWQFRSRYKTVRWSPLDALLVGW